MKENQTPIVRSNPAVAQLNQVPGFDPMALLQKAESTSRDGKEKKQLPLRFKKLWFRLAHPQGRIKLKALRITEQMAIIEAQVYLNLDDAEPVANFTSERTAHDAPNGQYVQAAQYEAQDNALTDAGFGIQLCDVCQVAGEDAIGLETSPAPAQEAPIVTPPQAVDPSPAPVQEQPAQEPQPTYPADMTADQILEVMTLEEALRVTPDVGMCKGQPLSQIADRRPASLKWYVYGCPEGSAMLKAAARIVLEDLNEQKTA